MLRLTHRPIAFSARQAEWLKTAKPSRTRLPVGTVVRLPDGVESYGPLRAGQLAVIASDDGSSWPYHVRTSDGVLHDTVYALRGLVEVEGGTVSESAPRGCNVLRWDRAPPCRRSLPPTRHF